MDRDEIPRIYELRDTLRDSASWDDYIQNFDDSVGAPIKQKCFKDIDAELQKLDNTAWDFC